MQQKYAKPYAGEKGTYIYHIGKCYRLWQELFQSREEALACFCSSVGIPLEEFREKSKKAVLFHDAGKLLPTFQQQMRRLIDKQSPDHNLHFRHEVASALLLLSLDWEKLKDNVNLIPYEILAVLGHHKSLRRDWHSFEREKSRQEPPRLDEREIDYVVQVAEFHGLQYKMNKSMAVQAFLVSQWPFLLFNNLSERLKTTTLDNITVSERRKLRLVYALLKGMLMTCDWLASTENEDQEQPVDHKMTSTCLRNKIKEKVEKEGHKYEDRPFHVTFEKTKGNILAIAPTGAGKTEAALLWATNQEPAKIIFLMPTMVTSNSLYQRMKDHYFTDKECGLIHSGADTFFAQQDVLDQDNTLVDFRLVLRKFRAFMAPVMVATVDQMLTGGFNIGSWCQKEWALVGSRVIFDEIHAYQAFTLGLISAAIEKVNLLGGRVCLMSATMPAFLREHFQFLLGVPAPIIAEELMGRQKCYWKYRETPVEEMTQEIWEYLKQGKKVAIVFNTVRAAQQAYREWEKKLGKERVLCYHSQFIMKERQEKENKLMEKDEKGRPNNYDLVIATQVIEVSLDISFDLIYSECAPLDSLIQRAGRCNRYNTDGEFFFIVFPASEKAVKYVYKGNKTVLERSAQIVRENQKLLREDELRKMLEYVYEGYKLGTDNADFQQGYKLYDEIAIATEAHGFIFDLPINEETVTRKFGDYLKVSIIPHNFYDDIEILWKKKEYAKLRLYEVPIPEYRYRKLNFVNNPMNLPIYSVPYTEEEGVLDADDDFPMRII